MSISSDDSDTDHSDIDKTEYEEDVRGGSGVVDVLFNSTIPSHRDGKLATAMSVLPDGSDIVRQTGYKEHISPRPGGADDLFVNSTISKDDTPGSADDLFVNSTISKDDTQGNDSDKKMARATRAEIRTQFEKFSMAPEGSYSTPDPTNRGR